MDNKIKHISVYFKDLNSADSFGEDLEEFSKKVPAEENPYFMSTIEEQVDIMLEDTKYLISTKDDFRSMVRIDISNEDVKIYTSYHCDCNDVEDPKNNEDDIDTDKLIKGALIAGGILLLGIIVGKKTSRYKKWKGKYSINKPFGMDDDDVSAINWFIEQQNDMWKKNHLVLVIDKKYKKPGGYRRK